MNKAKRIFFITDTKDLTDKLLLEGLRKQVKGFIRLGHDTQVFSYNNAFFKIGTFGGGKWTAHFYKRRVDELLTKQIKNYNPDIIIVSFAKFLDTQTIEQSRKAAPNATFAGYDVDIWPELHEGRIETATKLELVLTTFDGKGLESYKKAGVRCVFIPNLCDPDIEHRYEVSEQWRSDILFTGKAKHVNYPTDDIRPAILDRLVKMPNCALYGCYGRPFIGGIQYLYAISGARIGVSVNAVDSIRLYHSDRLTNYLACGTFTLAKRVPDTDLLFQDGIHLKYFDTVDEFFALADWYLKHDQEREKIAKAGMQHIHTEFNCQKIAKYMLDAIETGAYHASWTD